MVSQSARDARHSRLAKEASGESSDGNEKVIKDATKKGQWRMSGVEDGFDLR